MPLVIVKRMFLGYIVVPGINHPVSLKPDRTYDRRRRTATDSVYVCMAARLCQARAP